MEANNAGIDYQEKFNGLRRAIGASIARCKKLVPTATPQDALREISGTVLPLMAEFAEHVQSLESSMKQAVSYLASGAAAEETQLLPDDADLVAYVAGAADHLARKALEAGGLDAEGRAECEKIIQAAAEALEMAKETRMNIDVEEGEDEEEDEDEEDDQVSAPGASA